MTASSIREQISAELKSALLTANIVGNNVYRAREISLTKALQPAIVIMPDEEEVVRMSQNVDRNHLDLNINIYTRGDPWDSLADPIAVAMHKVITTDAVIRGLVADVRKVKSTWSGEEADRTAGCLISMYRFTYLTTGQDISSAPL